MRYWAAAFLTLFLLAGTVFTASPYVLVLGIAQDAGVPQIGCDSKFCRNAWADRHLVKTVASIAIVDPDSGERWIIDATPDLPKQFEFLKEQTGDRSNRISGIFLTHAHIGHYTGLMYLGREAMNSSGVLVYAMPRMRKMLEENAPWSQLVKLGNISIKPIEDRSRIALNERLSIEPFIVRHRDEFSETVGYRIISGKRSVIYIPDIDKWSKWQTSLADIVHTSDHLFLDGTFFADGEIARPMAEVPHPFVAETMTLLRDLPKNERAKISFIHFNHSNPLVQGDRKRSAEVRRLGFGVSRAGQRVRL
jgi:pyrroloquinoline quinone biosynthesis protein B